MNMLQLFNCAFGKHHRDRRRARYDGNDLHSVCIGCGQPMIRDFTGWRLAGAGGERPRPAPAQRISNSPAAPIPPAVHIETTT